MAVLNYNALRPEMGDGGDCKWLVDEGWYRTGLEMIRAGKEEETDKVKVDPTEHLILSGGKAINSRWSFIRARELYLWDN